MGAEILLTPLAAAIGILAAVVVLDAQTVFLKQVDVPLQLWSSGYSSLVMQEELANAMLDVEREGRAREATRELALEAGDDSIDLVTDYFELTPLVGAFQQSGGFVAYAVDSHVTVEWRQLRARARHHGTRRLRAHRLRHPFEPGCPGLHPPGCGSDHAGRFARAPVRILSGPGHEGAVRCARPRTVSARDCRWRPG